MRVLLSGRRLFEFAASNNKGVIVLDLPPADGRDLLSVKAVLDSHGVRYTVTPRYSNGVITHRRINVWLDQFVTNPSCPPKPPRELRLKPRDAPRVSAPTP